MRKFRCPYTVNATDSKTNRTGHLYYLLEEYANVASFQKAYSGIVEQNKNMPGLKKLNEIGKGVFLHTHKENFVMVIARKGNKILRLKVNKLTSMSSISELQDISKTITTTL